MLFVLRWGVLQGTFLLLRVLIFSTMASPCFAQRCVSMYHGAGVVVDAT